MKNAEKLRILGEVQKLLGVGVEQLPQALRRVLQVAATPPCLVSFAFSPVTGKLSQVSLSQVPQSANAYSAISQVALAVAQQFQKLAVEVTKNVVSDKEGVEGTQDTVEPRSGPNPDEDDDSGDGVESLP